MIQLCEKTLELAKSNAPPYNFGYQSSELDSAITERSASSGLWCISKIVKSYFYLGKLEEADNFLKNQEKSMRLMERWLLYRGIYYYTPFTLGISLQSYYLNLQ